MRPAGIAETASSRASRAAPARPLEGPARRGRRGAPPDALLSAAALREADATLARAAREGADMVGDACVVWRVVDGGRRIEPAATHHRDRRLRPALATFLEQAELRPDDLWPGQVIGHGAPVRVRRARLVDLGIDTGVGMRRAHAMLAPVLDGGRTVAVLAALRETREAEYSLREEVVLRRVGVKAAARLGARADDWGDADELERDADGDRASVGLDDEADAGGAEVDRDGDGGGGDRDRSDGDGGGGGDDGGDDDPGIPTNGGRPPGEGPGWAPPPAWLMDHVGVGVWIADREGATTYVNTAMTELLGRPSRQLIGRPMRELLDDVPQMVEGEYCMDAERCDRRLTQPDGRHVWLEMTSRPLVDDEGRRRGTLTTAIDVTERKKVEMASRRRVPRPHRRI